MKINRSAVRGMVVAMHEESFSLRTIGGQYLASIRVSDGRRIVKGSDGSVKMTHELIGAPELGEEVMIVRSTVREGVRRMWARAHLYDKLK